MSSIQAAIELTDRMSAPLYNICTAANMVISNFQAMQYASGAAFDTSSLDVARQNIADAVVQLQELSQEKVKISEPVTIPIQWQENNSPEVFLSSGVERFQQEIQSANNMMEQLCATQDAIAKQAYNTYIFPPEAFQNLNSMAVRVDHIREKISQMEASGAGMGFDAANSGIEHLREQLYQTMQIQAELNSAVENMDVSAANSAYLKLSQTVGNTERYIRDNTNEQMQFNNAVHEGSAQADNLLNKIIQMGGAYLSFQAVVGTMKQAVEYASDLAEVQNVVDVTFGSAAEQINTWSQAALDVYGINEVTAKQYTGTMGAMLKSSGLAGGAVVDMSTNLTALAADMASFYNLDTDTAFEKIRSGISGETEPLKQLGINMSVANLEAYAMSQGISEAYSEMSQAEQTTLRYNYLVQATADAQGDFARTSSSYANQVRLLGENWTEFTGMVASQVLPLLAIVIGELNDGISWMSNNWDVLQPIVIGAVSLFGGYTTALAINAMAHGASAIAEFAHSVALAHASKMTMAARIEQYGFNAALLSCPITWIVAGIIALIAILYAVVAHINKTRNEAVSATGIIAGAVSVLGASIINTFVIPAYNAIAAFVNFFGNVFNNPVAAIKVLFYDMALTIIGYISSMASAIETVINKIPGVTVDITSGLDGFYSQLEAAQQKVKDESQWVEYVGKMDFVDPENAYDKGYEWGQGVENKVKAFFGGAEDENTGSYGGESDTTNYLSNIAGDTSSISDSLDVSEEDLKYLRDIAEQEAINRFTTAEIKVDMSGMSNTVHNTNDLDGIVDGLTTRVLEAMEVVKQGV